MKYSPLYAAHMPQSFRRPWLALAAGLACFAAISFVRAAGPGQPEEIKFLEPKNVTGSVYADAGLKKLLFTFRRTATNNGSTVHVLREFTLPDGKPAARERVVYQAGKLKSYRLEELQSGARGMITLQPDATEPQVQRIAFEYVRATSKKSGDEKLRPNTLVNDMVAPFIRDHWAPLTNQAVVKCRLAALSQAGSVEFKVFKESERTWRGKPVILIRMEPTSLIVAAFVEPLRFTIEKEGEHRILQYFGPTTPHIRKHGKWEDLQAFTVFDAK